jgi:hypothetical protein
MSNKKIESNEEPTRPQTPVIDKVAATYMSTEKSFADLEARAATMRREIRDQSEAYARAQEERQRAAAQWDYEEEQRRRAVLDKQREEDRERERRNTEASDRVAAREKAFRDLAVELFGVPSDPFDPKAAAKALSDKLAKAEAQGKAIAANEAAKEYATKKSIDEANAAKDKALLEAENTRLKADNAKLEAENKRLSGINTDLAMRQGDLAKDAFQSAGGMQGKAVEIMQTSAQSTPRAPTR